MRKLTLAVGVLVVAASFMFTGAAMAALPLLQGSATIVTPEGDNSSPRALELTSDPAQPSGSITFTVATGTTFDEFTALSTDYYFGLDNTCGFGSPRFAISLYDPATGTNGIANAYIGESPSYNSCPAGAWTFSGDLLENGRFIDTSRLPGGVTNDPYALARVRYEDYLVTSVQLIVDDGPSFSDREQSVQVDNVDVNGTVYTFDQPFAGGECRNGGWQTLTRENGTLFASQGACIDYVTAGEQVVVVETTTVVTTPTTTPATTTNGD